jgi:hypothetical protein
MENNRYVLEARGESVWEKNNEKNLTKEKGAQRR